ncbi:putative short-chain dehydrogenase protein [Botrytis fragariae]|uniref:Putative short-chain dehydrogenase protein n=1 Tax=Botrytis fragariae TaxID=1964551 RepID=A0A8H6ASU8_9HELO|nr:putative short-chain dehydrogenase protein [Botrytis fragariae]KAF5873161.1 putative short-chain dehydrogenase protein [Botrytis fragariae]
MGNIFSQFYFIPTAALTEKTCPDQTDRVFLITGGYTGIGFQLCNILYSRNAIIWIAGRSESKAQKAISDIKGASPMSKGSIEFLQLDLSDLSTIKPAVNHFTARQQRLDVLVNNAGVMYSPRENIGAQGHELHMVTNCLSHYLLYQLLLPLLTKTAASSPTASVRVAWAASIAVHVDSSPSGMIINEDGCPKDQGVTANYSQSKVGNVFLARECAKMTPQTGIVHAVFNPGNLRTELQRYWTGPASWITDKFIVYPSIYGAYTELWAALSPELTPDKSGAYIYPWGRFGSLPEGIESSIVGESGISARFFGWCGRETEGFL